MTTPEANMGYRLKRVFDLCIAVLAFVVAAPIMLLTAMLVAIFPVYRRVPESMPAPPCVKNALLISGGAGISPYEQW